jgi:hypothetical protein
MKELFPGYYRKTESEIKQIWQNGVIMFDTNVLLNLYRYSDSTRDTILDLISKFSNQIYLPHQAALEYNRNRYEVIAEQEKAYNEFLEKISQIQKDLQSTNKPPFLSTSVDKVLNSIFEKVSAEVKESIKKYCEYLKDDPIYNTLSKLFTNRITVSFTEEELQKIYKEGDERYKLKVPPGYEDEKTKDGNRKFGDLVLWKQVIEKAKELKKDVILITDERKTDWWWKIKDGRNMGPRQELIEEIKKEANVDFHMYSSERFLSYGQSLLKEKINQQALEEIQAMKKAELEELKRIKSHENRRFEIEIKAKDEMNYLANKINAVNSKIFMLRQESEKIFKDSMRSDETSEYLHSIGIHDAELQEERAELISRLESLKKQISENENVSNIDRFRRNKYFNEFGDEKR